MWKQAPDHNERPPRSSRQRLARRVGLAACGFFLATGVYSMSQIHPDHEGFQIVDTQPIAATFSMQDAAVFDEAHDPSLYAPVDMHDARIQLSRDFMTSLGTLSALSLGSVGLGLLAGAGVLERRHLREHQELQDVQAVTSQLIAFDVMFEDTSALYAVRP